MNKRLLKIGGITVAVLIVAYIALELSLGSIVTAGVNRFAPKIVHTKVTLVGARISPFTGRGTLSGLTVGNPEGWTSDKAFAMETIEVDAVPSSLLGDHIVVNEILIDKPEFVYETRVLVSNIGELLKNISGSKGGEGQATTKSGKPIKFEVKHIRIQNGRVTVGVGPAAVTLPMPTIDLTDLGSKEGGITSDQLTLAIMRAVFESIITATTHAAGKIGSTMGAAATSGIKSLFGGSH